jgi:hypothetical protein
MDRRHLQEGGKTNLRRPQAPGSRLPAAGVERFVWEG